MAPKLAGGKRFWKSSFSHLYPVVGANRRHTVEINLDALRRIGIQPDEEERRLTLVPGSGAENFVDELLAEHGLKGRGFIHLHPTSRWLFKCWSMERMIALIAALQTRGHRIVVTAAPAAEEMAMAKNILAELPQPAVDLSGRLSLKQLAALTARAKLFIGVDSAPMHIAAAMGTPAVVLFGPSGDKEWGPWQVPHRILTSAHACRPCGNDGCGGGKTSECLSVIPVEQVLDAVREVMGCE